MNFVLILKLQTETRSHLINMVMKNFYMMRAETVTALSILPVFLGSITIFLWGGVGASLTAGLRRSGPLVALLVLPLFVPVVIFGSEVLVQSLTAQPIGAGLGLLAANNLAALAIAPFAMALALKLE